MPYYYPDWTEDDGPGEVWVEQSWIEANAQEDYHYIFSSELHNLIYELKYLHLHDDKSSLELLELLAERMES